MSMPNLSTSAVLTASSSESVNDAQINTMPEIDIPENIQLPGIELPIIYPPMGGKIIEGTDFNDTLEGSNGNDYVRGKAGDDLLLYSPGDDYYDGGTGSDTVSYRGYFNPGVRLTVVGVFLPGVNVNLSEGTASYLGWSWEPVLPIQPWEPSLTKHSFIENWFPVVDTLVNVENIVGSSDSDILIGDDQNNSIWAGDGHDYVEGGAGNDTLYGGWGAGRDTLVGGAGSDYITYENQESYWYWGRGTIWGDFVNVTDQGDDDIIFGSEIGDSIHAGGGDDWVKGDDGDEHNRPDSGWRFLSPDIDVWLNGDTDDIAISKNYSYGGDLIWGDAGNDLLEGGYGNDTIWGGEDNDTLKGGADNDTLYGGNGDDVLEGGDGNNWLEGGNGTDTATFENSAVGVFVNLDPNNTYQHQVPVDGAAMVPPELDAERYSGFVGNLVMSWPNLFWPTVSLDYPDPLNIQRAGGTFQLWTDFNLSPGAMDDALGNHNQLVNIENITASHHDDVVVGSGDANVIRGLAGNDWLAGLAGNDTLDGGDGDDTVIYQWSSGRVAVNLAENWAVDGYGSRDTLYNIEHVIGSSLNDWLKGNQQNNTLIGGDGHDTLDGGDGDDRLMGGNHNDLLLGGKGNDLLQGQTGNDLLFGQDGNDFLDGGADADSLYGGDGADILLGGDGNDELYGQAGIDWLQGDDGDDRLYGGDGHDYLSGDQGNDRLYGASGEDSLDGGAGDDGRDTLDGGDGRDLLIGGDGGGSLQGDAGNDTLYGGAGNDTLRGGNGTDILIGGGGADHFQLEMNQGWDIIQDFQIGLDKIQLAGLTFGDITITQGSGEASADAWVTSTTSGELMLSLANTDASLLTQASFLEDSFIFMF
jgi:Ca2+-binding RTX toxin-like protein